MLCNVNFISGSVFIHVLNASMSVYTQFPNEKTKTLKFTNDSVV